MFGIFGGAKEFDGVTSDTGTHGRLDTANAELVTIDSDVNAIVTSLGTDGGSTPPNGIGVRGWLRGIYDKLNSGISATITDFPVDYPNATAHTDAASVLAALATIDAHTAANASVSVSNFPTYVSIANIVTVTGALTINNSVFAVTGSGFATSSKQDQLYNLEADSRNALVTDIPAQLLDIQNQTATTANELFDIHTAQTDGSQLAQLVNAAGLPIGIAARAMTVTVTNPSSATSDSTAANQATEISRLTSLLFAITNQVATSSAQATATSSLATLHTDLGHLTDNTQTTKITNGTQAADTTAGDSGSNAVVTAAGIVSTAISSATVTIDLSHYPYPRMQLIGATFSVTTQQCDEPTFTAPNTCPVQLATMANVPTSGSISNAAGHYMIYPTQRYFRLNYVSGTVTGTLIQSTHAPPYMQPMAAQPVSQSGTFTATQGQGASVTPWAVGGRLPTVSLNAVVASGTTPTVWDTGGCHSAVTMALHFSGTVATSSVALQGSMDNVTWFTLQTSTAIADAFVSNTGQPFRYFRASCTVLTGASPVLTATIASVV